MDISAALIALFTSLGIPVFLVVPISIIATMLVQKYFPNLSSLLALFNKDKTPPTTPTPTPVPTPEPAPILPDRPVLSAILTLLAKLKSNTPLSVEEKVMAELVVKQLVPPTVESK